MMKIELDNGKYTYILNEQTGDQKALRHGEPWRDLVGDKFVMSMAFRISELEAIVAELPRTADGVPVVPGMVVWQKPGLISGKKCPPREVQADVLMSEDGMLGEVEEYRWTYYASDCYSTPQAAAKKEPQQ